MLQYCFELISNYTPIDLAGTFNLKPDKVHGLGLINWAMAALESPLTTG